MPPTYFAVITTLGATKLATAQASDNPLLFTHLAVGDGGGSTPTPNVAQTALVNERARVSINLVQVDPANPNTVRVEGLIPAATGGFVIREAGIFDEDDDLIAVANYPDIYKPSLSDGVSIEEYIRILLVYASPGSAIDLIVDTSVIIATRLYVDDGVQAAKDYADSQIQNREDLPRKMWMSAFEGKWIGTDYVLSNIAALPIVTSASAPRSIVWRIPVPSGGDLFSVSIKVNKAGTGVGTVYLHQVSNLGGSSSPTETVLAVTHSSTAGHQTITVTFSVTATDTDMLFVEYESGNADVVQGALAEFSLG